MISHLSANISILLSGFDTLKIERMEQENGSSDVAVVSRSELNDLCERLLDILVELTHIGIALDDMANE